MDFKCKVINFFLAMGFCGSFKDFVWTGIKEMCLDVVVDDDGGASVVFKALSGTAVVMFSTKSSIFGVVDTISLNVWLGVIDCGSGESGVIGVSVAATCRGCTLGTIPI